MCKKPLPLIMPMLVGFLLAGLVSGTALADDEGGAPAVDAAVASSSQAVSVQEEEDDHDDHDHDDHEGEDHGLHAGHFHEDVVVTGSAIEEPGINLPYAVEVLGRDVMREQGSPLVVDLFKNLTAGGAVIGEANSWYNDQGVAVPETVANVNLRGLGPSRTLVLLNSRRQVQIPARLFGGRYVDVNMIPSIAVERIEVLKEGAAAIYGSDAVAGVANFVTRDDFEGFEVTLSHDHFDGAGDSLAGIIWGKEVGSSHLVVSLERASRSELTAEERPYTIRPRTDTFWGWSNTGNPGIFLQPRLTGNETAGEFVNALSSARNGAAGSDYFVDPACTGLGGFDRGFTCAFRYQQWDSLVEDMDHTRLFAELNGPLSDTTDYHVEVMFGEAVIPNYDTTPSFPPVTLLDGQQLISNAHPGRVEFCSSSYALGGFTSEEACMQDDWYFHGRLVGNAGPGRGLHRRSDTSRIAASIDRGLTVGGKSANLDVGVSLSRATGNMNQPSEYGYRKFLAFRGFGGPNCGVGVVADPSAPSGMRLGATGSAQPGVGDCHYYNPFGNAIEYSAQVGAPWRDSPNPGFVAGLENNREMMDWINDRVNLDNEAEMLVADATLSGVWIEDRANYAFGYQFRRLDVSALPNDPGNYEINPCVVPGDRSCVDPATGLLTGSRAGQFTFTSGFYPYDDSQSVHRLFSELSLNLGDRGDMQVAANYELHDHFDSFDPKLSARWTLSEGDNHSLAVRGSVQTTFRAPSVDDLNEDVQTALEYVDGVGVYKALDTFGNRDLVPESALTYNLGLVLFASAGFDVTLDYWSYDFENVVAREPTNDIVRLYAEGLGGDPAKLNAVRDNIICPGGMADASCAASDLERIILRVINWPGIETSGFDLHLHAGRPLGNGAIEASLSSTYLLEYRVKALRGEGVEYVAERDVAGLFNREFPAAPSLPELRTRGSVGYHWGNYGLVGYLNYISSYEDAYIWTRVLEIDEFLTADLTFLWSFPNLGVDLALSALNLMDERPPLADFEQGFDALIHNAKGRRLKAAITYRFGS